MIFMIKNIPPSAEGFRNIEAAALLWGTEKDLREGVRAKAAFL